MKQPPPTAPKAPCQAAPPARRAPAPLGARPAPCVRARKLGAGPEVRSAGGVGICTWTLPRRAHALRLSSPPSLLEAGSRRPRRPRGGGSGPCGGSCGGAAGAGRPPSQARLGAPGLLHGQTHFPRAPGGGASETAPRESTAGKPGSQMLAHKRRWALQTADPESLGEAPGSGLRDGKARGKGVERTRRRFPSAGLPTFSGALPRLCPHGRHRLAPGVPLRARAGGLCRYGPPGRGVSTELHPPAAFPRLPLGPRPPESQRRPSSSPPQEPGRERWLCLALCPAFPILGQSGSTLGFQHKRPRGLSVHSDLPEQGAAEGLRSTCWEAPARCRVREAAVSCQWRTVGRRAGVSAGVAVLPRPVQDQGRQEEGSTSVDRAGASSPRGASGGLLREEQPASMAAFAAIAEGTPPLSLLRAPREKAAQRFGRRRNRGGPSISAKSPGPPGHQLAHVVASAFQEAQLSSGHRAQLHGREGSLLTILPALFGEQGFCSCLGFVLKMNIERRRKQSPDRTRAGAHRHGLELPVGSTMTAVGSTITATAVATVASSVLGTSSLSEQPVPKPGTWLLVPCFYGGKPKLRIFN
uniref:Uncharacterized protein n=1 Tax=Rangifer tarandus platyrhynchus TaxID=3082113 RepID=A0ACB0FGF4_RANTA|nr:unnamed protein product [Rangifer tarandus platyrhynchus]